MEVWMTEMLEARRIEDDNEAQGSFREIHHDLTQSPWSAVPNR